jgi:signal transduction histidine kinase
LITPPSLGRYLAVRALMGGAVALLLALHTPWAWTGGATALISFVAASSVLTLILGRDAGVRRIRALLALSTVLDIAVESVLIAATGASRSPFVLLYSVTIGATGLFFGLSGGLGMALGAVVGYWTGIIVKGGETEISSALASAFLLILGFLSGFLGHRAGQQRREMECVRGELERVRLDAEAIVGSLTSPLICIDRTGMIRRANAAAIELLGLWPDPEGSQLEGSPHPARIAPLLGYITRAFVEGEANPAELLLPPTEGGEGGTPVETIASIVRDREGRTLGLVLLVTDVTRRKELEGENARRERLAVIGELSGHLAHEIRNSLKPVVGSIELLAQEIPSYGVAGELTAIILREGEALEKFLGDFLAFTRDKSLTIEEFDLDELLQDEVASVSRHPARAREVTLRALPGPRDERIRTDRGAVRDILRNLLLNALEATRRGDVTIGWSTTDGEGIEVRVEDSGVGFGLKDPESLFEAFHTEKLGGTGLGLTIARKLARRLGGEVVLETRSPVGARALLRIPGCRLPECPERIAA